MSSPPKYSESIQLPLLCASIKEGMRLHPSVGLTMPRIAPKGGMTLCNQYIPEGYSVGMNGAVVHYDKSVFGADADQFRPQRWLEGDAKKMDKYMLHFGAGTRTCIGKNVSISLNRWWTAAMLTAAIDLHQRDPQAHPLHPAEIRSRAQKP